MSKSLVSCRHQATWTWCTCHARVIVTTLRGPTRVPSHLHVISCWPMWVPIAFIRHIITRLHTFRNTGHHYVCWILRFIAQAEPIVTVNHWSVFATCAIGPKCNAVCIYVVANRPRWRHFRRPTISHGHHFVQFSDSVMFDLMTGWSAELVY